MVVRDHPSLSLSRQCRLLSIGRSSLYYEPKGESAETLALMRRIDELFVKYPFYGARQMVRHLRREGVRIGRRRAAWLMRLVGFQAVWRAPRTSAPHPAHRVWPWRLKGLRIERANHVWCADITYIPVQRGFLYLAAIMDRASRFVLAWRLSNTRDAGFCTDALEEALARYGTPEIFNTDQGSQFTSFAFTGRLQAPGIRISMDGRGRCMDNIFIERLWRSLKYEAVCLHEIADGFTARRVIGEWIGFCNTQRPHSALGGRTPAEAYPQAQQQQQEERFIPNASHMNRYSEASGSARWGYGPAAPGRIGDDVVLVGQPLPPRPAGVSQGGDVLEHVVGEAVRFQEQNDLLHRIEFRTVGRQMHERQVGGTRRSPERCQPAPSSTITPCAPGATAAPITARCSFIDAVFALSATWAMPTPRCAQVAPNR